MKCAKEQIFHDEPEKGRFHQTPELSYDPRGAREHDQLKEKGKLVFPNSESLNGKDTKTSWH